MLKPDRSWWAAADEGDGGCCCWWRERPPALDEEGECSSMLLPLVSSECAACAGDPNFGSELDEEAPPPPPVFFPTPGRLFEAVVEKTLVPPFRPPLVVLPLAPTCACWPEDWRRVPEVGRMTTTRRRRRRRGGAAEENRRRRRRREGEKESEESEKKGGEGCGGCVFSVSSVCVGVCESAVRRVVWSSVCEALGGAKFQRRAQGTVVRAQRGIGTPATSSDARRHPTSQGQREGRGCARGLLTPPAHAFGSAGSWSQTEKTTAATKPAKAEHRFRTGRSF